jgi:hypothetical protein
VTAILGFVINGDFVVDALLNKPEPVAAAFFVKIA